MAERSAGKLRRAGPEAAGVAREIMGRGLWVVAQREGAAEGRDLILALVRDTMAGRAGASQSLVSAGSELGHAWLVLWHERFAEGMKATREILAWQNAFARASLELTHVRMRQGAELAGEMTTGSFQPMRVSAREATGCGLERAA
jgi:hypothetical protein